MTNHKEMTGQKIGRWEFIKKVPTPEGKEKGAHYLCRCDCGKEMIFPAARIRAGRSQNSCKSCNGYFVRRRGNGYNGAYKSWRAMRSRCLVKSDTNYKAYGGAGIKISEAWAGSFEAFYNDMGDRPAGKTIDRIDPFKGYSKDNCRWASQREQSHNKRLKTMTDEQKMAIKKAYSLGLIQEELATLTGFSRAHIANVIKGRA